MLIKDLPKNLELSGIKIKIPEKHTECPLREGYWKSQWGYPDGKAGIWVSDSPTARRIYPVFLNKLKDALEFEVVET